MLYRLSRAFTPKFPPEIFCGKVNRFPEISFPDNMFQKLHGSENVVYLYI